TLHPAPCTLHPAPCTLHPAPCTLHPAPCTLHPAPCILHSAPWTGIDGATSDVETGQEVRTDPGSCVGPYPIVYRRVPVPGLRTRTRSRGADIRALNVCLRGLM
ncbi:hypothetical protein T484DRAFT_3643615, partial [Baffinella frigidus]